jgi:hypothetical protein
VYRTRERCLGARGFHFHPMQNVRGDTSLQLVWRPVLNLSSVFGLCTCDHVFTLFSVHVAFFLQPHKIMCVAFI